MDIDWSDVRVVRPEEMGTRAVCMVADCSSTGTQLIERIETLDEAQQINLFGRVIHPGTVDCCWLECGHSLSYGFNAR